MSVTPAQAAAAGETIAGASNPNDPIGTEPTAKEQEAQGSAARNMMEAFFLPAMQINPRLIGANLVPPHYGTTAATSDKGSTAETDGDDTTDEPKKSGGMKMKIGKNDDDEKKANGDKKADGKEKASSKDTPKAKPVPSAAPAVKTQEKEETEEEMDARIKADIAHKMFSKDPEGAIAFAKKHGLDNLAGQFETKANGQYMAESLGASYS